jgi:hypothetical protein
MPRWAAAANGELAAKLLVPPLSPCSMSRYLESHGGLANGQRASR